MADEWFYVQDGQQYGPCSLEQLQSLTALGLVKPDDTLWKQGMADWLPAKLVPGLFKAPTTSTATQPVPSDAPASVPEPVAIPEPVSTPEPATDALSALSQATENSNAHFRQSHVRRTKSNLPAALLAVGVVVLAVGLVAYLVFNSVSTNDVADNKANHGNMPLPPQPATPAPQNDPEPRGAQSGPHIFGFDPPPRTSPAPADALFGVPEGVAAEVKQQSLYAPRCADGRALAKYWISKCREASANGQPQSVITSTLDPIRDQRTKCQDGIDAELKTMAEARERDETEFNSNKDVYLHNLAMHLALLQGMRDEFVGEGVPFPQ